jgi:hypothetical protein
MKYVKDLLITDRLLLKGHVNTGSKRLSTFLNDHRGQFLEMDEVMLLKHESCERVSVPSMMLRIDEILLAHELGEAGDEVLKGLAERQKDEMSVAVHFNGHTSLQVSGEVRKRAWNAGTLHQHHFIVMVEPKLTGLPLKEAPEYAALKNPSYVIVNRNRIAFVTI